METRGIGFFGERPHKFDNRNADEKMIRKHIREQKGVFYKKAKDTK